jgi:DNA-binding transcriptional MerR regulator
MRIGELSRRTGVSVRMLRYYEEQGMLAPERLPSGYREFAETDVQTVKNIRVLLAAGLNTATIAEVLPCVVDEDGFLLPGCPELLQVFGRERDRITGSIEELESARAILDGILTAPVPTDNPYYATAS